MSDNANAAYDLIIIGGGITGAGVFREAVKTGAKVLLLEQRDFASGTSSWSSKLVHGGLRYLKSGQWRLTLESVRERERLMREAAGLVEPLGFAMPLFQGASPGPALMRTGLGLYDLMAGRRRSRWMPRGRDRDVVPGLNENKRLGILYYEDARTDDVRLTLRLIFEAIAEGGEARSYTPVSALHREQGRVAGVVVDGQVIRAHSVVNAAGAWADGLGGDAPKLRPLRGSHLLFARDQLPVTLAVSWLHPEDRRPVFAFPWEGVVLLGTTDLDHDQGLHAPRVTAAEAEYLIAGLRHAFPALALQAKDAVAAFAGVRPVVAGGAAKPSDESRESAMWSEPGLVGITGGKLTTFRVTARKVLSALAKQNPRLTPAADERLFCDRGDGRLAGRYGGRAARAIGIETRDMIGRTPYALRELAWCARHEQVRHLDDLLLRRVRLGLVAPRGGEAHLHDLEAVCREALGWEQTHWREEVERYRALWHRQHDPECLS
jgi:glycerol-3-phosphate dehydrogenase